MKGSGFKGSEVMCKGEYRIMNVECRMSNVEGMHSVNFIKKIELSETTLRHSAVRCSTSEPLNPKPLNPEPLNPEPLNPYLKP